MKKEARQDTKHGAARLKIHRETLQNLSALRGGATLVYQCHSGEHTLCSLC